MRNLGFLLLALAVSLGACSYTLYLSGADEHGGTVNMVTQLNKDDAVEKANEHCRQYGRTARIIHTDPQSSSMTFSCQ
jgi:hypothetical protein